MVHKVRRTPKKEFDARYRKYHPPLEQKHWPKNESVSKPYFESVWDFTPEEPENPNCKVCKDKGTHFIKIKAGHSRRVTCDCGVKPC